MARVVAVALAVNFRTVPDRLGAASCRRLALSMRWQLAIFIFRTRRSNKESRSWPADNRKPPLPIAVDLARLNRPSTPPAALPPLAFRPCRVVPAVVPVPFAVGQPEPPRKLLAVPRPPAALLPEGPPVVPVESVGLFAVVRAALPPLLAEWRPRCELAWGSAPGVAELSRGLVVAPVGRV